MKVTTEKPAAGVASLTVELPPEELERAVDQAWRRLANRVNIPGFRRGKAPRPLVERHVGAAAIDEEALRRLLPERYDAAVEQAGIAPLERPSFDVVQLERGKPLIFKATAAVLPTVELGELRSIAIPPDVVEVAEEEVDRILNRLREGQAQWVPVEDRGLELGDQAIADVKIEFAPTGEGPGRTSEQKDLEVVLGEHGFPEGFDQQLTGARPGESRRFPLSWQLGPFPAESAAGDTAQEAGEGNEAPAAAAAAAAAAPEMRSATFTVHVKDVKRKQLPELDDDFAKSLGDHDTLAELRESVRLRLGDEALRNARLATENKALDAAIDQATFEIADRLIDREAEALAEERQRTLAQQRMTVERYLQLIGTNEADWRAEIREQATRQLKGRLVLDELAEKEELVASSEQVEEEIERTARSYGDQADQVRRSLMTEEARRRIATSLRRRKALEELVGHAGGYPQGTAEPVAIGDAATGDAATGDAATMGETASTDHAVLSSAPTESTEPAKLAVPARTSETIAASQPEPGAVGGR